MIALLKVFRVSVNKEAGIIYAAGAYPYGIYINGELEPIDESSLLSVFPNSGKVFVPNSYTAPQSEVFKLCELIEATYFEEGNPKFSKYSLEKDVMNLDLYEVIDLDETIEKSKHLITENLLKGISLSFIPSDFIYFRTADDYIIGPVKLELQKEKYIVKDYEFVGYYKQDLNITRVFDHFKNQERLFCIEKIEDNNIKGWIDLATDQRVISDVLKQLKEYEEFGEITRKVTSRLKEWYSEVNEYEPHIKERINRTINLISNKSLDKETQDTFTERLLNLEASGNVIDTKVRERFDEQYENFILQNNSLLQNITKLEQYINDLTIQAEIKEERLRTVDLQLNTVQETMNKKIYDMQFEFAEVYAEQLATSSLPQSQTIKPSIKEQTLSNSLFSNSDSYESEYIYNIIGFERLLQENLKIFGGKDNELKLSSTILTSLKLQEPILIYGENSLILAKCITKSIASSQSITIIPEIETFNLNNLNIQNEKFNSLELVKAMIISNPHVTSAFYSLPLYIKEQKWRDEKLNSNIIIITLDSLKDADDFIDRMPNSPLIKSADYIRKPVVVKYLSKIVTGQLYLTSIDDLEFSEFSNGIYKRFNHWIEDVKDEDLKSPKNLIVWLNQLVTFIPNEEELFEWCYKLFKQSFYMSKGNGKDI